MAANLEPADLLSHVFNYTEILHWLWKAFKSSDDYIHADDVIRKAACVTIRQWQNWFFGPFGFNKSVHISGYLGPVPGRHPDFDPSAPWFFEMTTPKAKWFSLEDIAGEDIRILRHSEAPFSLDDITFLVENAELIKGQEYDEKHLVNFLLRAILGYPENTVPLLDDGKKFQVCSTVWRALFEALRRKRHPEWNRLFDIVDLHAWEISGRLDRIDHQLKDGDRIETAVEWTAPAHFDNGGFFNNEFRFITRVRNGKRID